MAGARIMVPPPRVVLTGAVASGWARGNGKPAGQNHHRGGDDDCAYCGASGHWKDDCPLLKGKGKGKEEDISELLRGAGAFTMQILFGRLALSLLRGVPGLDLPLSFRA